MVGLRSSHRLCLVCQRRAHMRRSTLCLECWREVRDRRAAENLRNRHAPEKSTTTNTTPTEGEP